VYVQVIEKSQHQLPKYIHNYQWYVYLPDYPKLKMKHFFVHFIKSFSPTGPFFFFEETVKSGQNKRSFKTKKNQNQKNKKTIVLLLMFEEVVQLMVVY